ncbi:MAG: DUF3592 domain-containing protein [Bryobacteraceae bacterium]
MQDIEVDFEFKDWKRRRFGALLWIAVALNWFSLLFHGHHWNKRVWMAAYFAVLGLASLVTWAVRARRRRARPSWPSATGIVEYAKVGDLHTLLRRYAVLIRYTYYVGGERYSGLDGRRFRCQRDAEAAALRARGATVQARYNPLDPDQCVLAWQDNAPLLSAAGEIAFTQ